MHYGLAIDSYLAVADFTDSGEVETVLNETGNTRTPAVVQVREDQILVGDSAVRERMMYPDATTGLTPNSLDDESVVQAGETSLSGPDAWTLLARHATAGTFRDDSHVTVAVPDTLGYDERRSLHRVLKELGATESELVDRSIAACVCTEQIPPPGTTVLVCHLSDAALSCAVVAHGPHGVEVVDAIRDTALGTEAIDDSLYEPIRTELLEAGHPDPDDNDALRFDIYDNIRQMKHTLSNAEEAGFGVGIGGEAFSRSKRRDEVFEHCADYLSAVKDLLRRILDSPAVDAHPVALSDTASLVGPEGDVFVLAAAVDELLDADPATNTEPDALARAAARLSAGDTVLPGASDAEPSETDDPDSPTDDAESASEEATPQSSDSESRSDVSVDADLSADDPFEVLGADRTTPLHVIRERATELFGQFDTDDAITTLSEAYEAIADGPHVKRVGDTTIEPLVVDSEASSPTVGETVLVTVTDIDGRPVEDATVELDGSSVGVTDEDGKLSVQLSTAGEHSLSATKRHPEDGHEFRSGTTRVEVEQRRISLSFFACPASTTAGDGFELGIEGEDGPLGGVTILSPAGDFVTGQDGTAELTLSRPGQVTLLAKKESTANRTYESVSRTLTVRPREVSLHFSGVPSSVVAGATHEVTVVDSDGDAVPDVEISLPDTTVLTDEQGAATVYFDDALPDTVTLEASKPETDKTVFTGDTVEVAVNRSQSSTERALSISADTDRATVGEQVTYEVTDETGHPVESVYVSGTDGNSDMTDSDGRATITFESPGTKSVSASPTDGGSHGEYAPAGHEIDVARRTVSLALGGLPSATAVGESVELTVRFDAGEPVADATVAVDDTTQATTDDAGHAELSFDQPGQRTVRASKESSAKAAYDQTAEDIDVYANRLEFDTCPDVATVGEAAQVRLVDADGNPVSGVVVSTPNQGSERTADDGTADIVFETTGVKHIKADVPDAEAYEYSKAIETVRVRGEG
jgi:uncharacterized GH25 family protein